MTARSLLLALAATAVSATPAAAQDPGATAAPVLRLAPAPRALALGGAYASLSDALSAFYNPARLAAASPAATLAYRTLPVEAGVGAAALAMRLGPGTLGAGVQFLNYGEIDVVEPDPATGGEIGVPTGERVGGGELVVTAAYGLRLPGRIEVGVAAKLLRLQLAEAAATGTAFDLGAGLEVLDGRVTLGAAVQNLGADIGPGRDAPLPRRVRAGAALHLDGPAGFQAVLVAEALEEGGAVAPLGGIEIGRAGPGGSALVGRLGYDGSGGAGGPDPLVAGAGLALDGVTLDYAYRELGALGSAHVFGISLRLGSRD
ncbi:MAG TPA: PorV/PorQ family protein [Longimicrobiales bacterium]